MITVPLFSRCTCLCLSLSNQIIPFWCIQSTAYTGAQQCYSDMVSIFVATHPSTLVREMYSNVSWTLRRQSSCMSLINSRLMNCFSTQFVHYRSPEEMRHETQQDKLLDNIFQYHPNHRCPDFQETNDCSADNIIPCRRTVNIFYSPIFYFPGSVRQRRFSIILHWWCGN